MGMRGEERREREVDEGGTEYDEKRENEGRSEWE
jgi:hypothetical protein